MANAKVLGSRDPSVDRFKEQINGAINAVRRHYSDWVNDTEIGLRLYAIERILVYIGPEGSETDAGMLQRMEGMPEDKVCRHVNRALFGDLMNYMRSQVARRERIYNEAGNEVLRGDTYSEKEKPHVAPSVERLNVEELFPTLALHEINGWSLREIAAELGVSHQAIAKRIKKETEAFSMWALENDPLNGTVAPPREQEVSSRVKSNGINGKGSPQYFADCNFCLFVSAKYPSEEKAQDSLQRHRCSEFSSTHTFCDSNVETDLRMCTVLMLATWRRFSPDLAENLTLAREAWLANVMTRTCGWKG